MDKQNHDALIIAEVGQNHQGELDKAREYIRVFALAGADVIKFQTRNNKSLFSEDAYAMPYNSENAFAETYGAHREHLELKPEWLPVLLADCHQYGVRFMSTPFDDESLDLLCDIGVDMLKVASFDLGNLPFLDRMARTGKPIVMSTGGGTMRHIRASVDTLLQHNSSIMLLHCVSEYPCEYDRLGLKKIQTLAKEFPRCTVGLSDHFNGTLSGPIAYMLGARVFEKHVTLNRSWKGTDHSFALESEGFRKFTRDIRRVRKMLPPVADEELGKEAVFKKLGKSLTARVDIAAGQPFDMNTLSGKIFTSQMVPVRATCDVLGRIAKRDIKAGEPLQPSDFE